MEAAMYASPLPVVPANTKVCQIRLNKNVARTGVRLTIAEPYGQNFHPHPRPSNCFVQNLVRSPVAPSQTTLYRWFDLTVFENMFYDCCAPAAPH